MLAMKKKKKDLQTADEYHPSTLLILFLGASGSVCILSLHLLRKRLSVESFNVFFPLLHHCAAQL